MEVFHIRELDGPIMSQLTHFLHHGGPLESDGLHVGLLLLNLGPGSQELLVLKVGLQQKCTNMGQWNKHHVQGRTGEGRFSVDWIQ